VRKHLVAVVYFPLAENGLPWIFKNERIIAKIKTFGNKNEFHGTVEELFHSNLPMICHLEKEHVYKKIKKFKKYILIDEHFDSEVIIELK